MIFYLKQAEQLESNLHIFFLMYILHSFLQILHNVRLLTNVYLVETRRALLLAILIANYFILFYHVYIYK